MASTEPLISDDELLKELLLMTTESMVKEKLNIDSKTDLIPVLKVVMEMIEEKEVSKDQKLFLAKKVLEKLIQDGKMMDNEQKQLCLDLINNGLIENTIKLIADASKGKIKINKKELKEKAKRGCISWLISKLQEINKSSDEVPNQV